MLKSPKSRENWHLHPYTEGSYSCYHSFFFIRNEVANFDFSNIIGPLRSFLLADWFAIL